MMLLALSASSCTSFRAVDPLEARTELEPGQRVRIKTQAGQSMTFKVNSLTEDEIIGQEQRVPYADVSTLERRELSWWKTLGLTFAGVGVASVVSGENELDFDNLASGS